MRRQQLINYFIGTTSVLIHVMMIPAAQALVALSQARPNHSQYADYIAAHMLTPLTPRPCQCRQCGARFIDQKSLHFHYRGHQAHEHVCGRCGNIFSSKEMLMRHQNSYFSLQKLLERKIINQDAYTKLLPCRPLEIR